MQGLGYNLNVGLLMLIQRAPICQGAAQSLGALSSKPSRPPSTLPKSSHFLPRCRCQRCTVTVGKQVDQRSVLGWPRSGSHGNGHSAERSGGLRGRAHQRRGLRSCEGGVPEGAAVQSGARRRLHHAHGLCGGEGQVSRRRRGPQRERIKQRCRRRPCPFRAQHGRSASRCVGFGTRAIMSLLRHPRACPLPPTPGCPSLVDHPCNALARFLPSARKACATAANGATHSGPPSPSRGPSADGYTPPPSPPPAMAADGTAAVPTNIPRMGGTLRKNNGPSVRHSAGIMPLCFSPRRRKLVTAPL